MQHQPVLRRPDPTTGPPLPLQHPTGQVDQVRMSPVQPRRHHRHLGLEVVDLLPTQDHPSGNTHAPNRTHVSERRSDAIHSRAAEAR